MFYVFKSFADFDGCAEGQHLWVFDCETKCKHGKWYQNRTWCVSDLPRDEVEKRANRYANATYRKCLRFVDFFDPSGPDVDFMGNFGEWYASDENKTVFMKACEMGYEKMDEAIRLLIDSGLDANMGDIWDVPMWHVTRDILNAE